MELLQFYFITLHYEIRYLEEKVYISEIKYNKQFYKESIKLFLLISETDS